MPENIKIGAFAFGAILVLIAILGGNFKLFGAEVAATISNRFLRFVAFALGAVFLVIATYPSNSGESPNSQGTSSPQPIRSSQPSPSSSASDSVISPTQPKLANIPLGKWSGMAKDPSGTSFPINVEINRDCSLNTKCGYISVPKVPCYGEISFVNINNDYYEFDVSDFDPRSDPKICKPGAGELFRLLPDGRLAYKATYSNAEGVLKRVGNGH